MTLPPVADSFSWIRASWGAALQCAPLALVADHLFTTRQLELSSPDGTRALAEALGARDVASATQVHGVAVAIVRQGSPVWATRPEADILLSNDAAVAVSVRAADCAPILIADGRGGAVAAVHAGWRGTAAGAVVVALETMASEFGTRPSDAIVAIGPSIGVCCYEVGPELVDAFAAAGHARHLIDRWFSTPRPVAGGRDPETDSDRIPSRMHRPPLRLDVAGSNRDQLILAGVPEEQIHVSGLCTAMHLDVLTSYRAEKEKAVRIAGAIRPGTGGVQAASPR